MAVSRKNSAILFSNHLDIMKQLYFAALILCCNVSFSQTIDTNFGSEGYLELPIDFVVGVQEVENSILIHDNFSVHSYNLNGAVNTMFGQDGIDEAPFDKESQVILKSFILNDHYTLMGCFTNEELEFDLAISQLNIENGEIIPDFELSYESNENNDEFLDLNFVEDTLRIFGSNYTIDALQIPSKIGSGIYANVDLVGNIISPSNQYNFLEWETGFDITYLYAFELNSGKVIHFLKSTFNFDYVDHFVLVTDYMHEITEVDLDEAATPLGDFGLGINQIFQLDDDHLLIIQNRDHFSQLFERVDILNLTNFERTDPFTDLFPEDYNIRDVVVTETGKIIIAGDVGSLPYNQTAFIAMLYSDFSFDGEFGINGIYEFQVKDQNSRIKKIFQQDEMLYMNVRSEVEEGQFEELLMRMDLSAEFSSDVQELDQINMEIYPNPFHDFIVVETESAASFKLKMFDAQGKEVYSEETVNESLFRINSAHLPSGVYIIEIKNKETGLKILKKVTKTN